MMVDNFYASTREKKQEDLWVWERLELQSETLSPKKEKIK